MLELIQKKVIFVAGKGGVGRTTFAAALALAAAKTGKRVLVAEITEPTVQTWSPLAELFGQTLFGDRTREIAPGIDGVMLEPRRGMEIFLRDVFKSRSMVALAMRSKALRRFVQAAPSVHELGVFQHLLHLVSRVNEAGRPVYDLTVLDMPATGHALALTGLPSIILSLVPGGPIAAALHAGQAIFNNPALTAGVIVALPETLPVSEALELLEGMLGTDVPVGAMVINRLPSVHFSAKELAALRDLPSGAALLGMRSVEKISQAAACTQRLRDMTDLPVYTLNEATGTGRTLVETLVDSILAEERCAGSLVEGTP
ncbi:MAG: ArsA-related P-loop ATPase [Pseudomonadota bacterium]